MMVDFSINRDFTKSLYQLFNITIIDTCITRRLLRGVCLPGYVQDIVTKYTNFIIWHCYRCIIILLSTKTVWKNSRVRQVFLHNYNFFSDFFLKIFLNYICIVFTHLWVTNNLFPFYNIKFHIFNITLNQAIQLLNLRYLCFLDVYYV